MKIKREVKIGLYAVLMLVALYWGINFLRGRDLFNTTNTYFGTYDQVNGIQKSSPIMIRGFKVGAVGDITFDPRVSDKIVLHLNIKSKYKIPDNSQARIYSEGLLGGKAVEIILGNSERYLQDGDTLHSVVDKNLLEVAGSELEILKQKATVLLDNMNKTLVSVNGLFVDNSQSINTTLNNFAEMSTSLNSVITGERKTLKELLRNVNDLSAALKQNTGNIDNIITNFEGFSENLASTDIKAIADNLSATLAQLDCTLARLNSGDGTAGRLLTDDELYDSMLKAVNNLSILLEDLKAHPGRYVSVSVFGRKAK